MPKVLVGVYIVLVFTSFGFCGDVLEMDSLTEKSIQSFKNHSFCKPVIYNSNKKIYYFEGYSGDIDTFGCMYKVNMTLDFSKIKIRGEYHYLKRHAGKMSLKGNIDSDNDIVLVEVIDNKWEGYTFKGVFKDGIVRGVWSKGSGKKAFAFYAVEVKDK